MVATDEVLDVVGAVRIAGLKRTRLGVRAKTRLALVEISPMIPYHI